MVIVSNNSTTRIEINDISELKNSRHYYFFEENTDVSPKNVDIDKEIAVIHYSRIS